MTFPIENIHNKFPYHYHLDDLPKRQSGERWCQTADRLVVHATDMKNVERIIEEGLKPRGETYCRVWDDDRIPQYLVESGDVDVDDILQCREESVYFWDDYCEGVGQGYATVSYLGEGNPALLVVDSKRLKLLKDPENPSDPLEEPISMLHKGEVYPDEIMCICKLRDEFIPDLGRIACNQYSQNPCKEFDIDRLWEDVNEPSNWECLCKFRDMKEIY